MNSHAPRDPPLYLGVDLGGTKVGVALVDEGGGVLAYDRRPTDAARGARAVVASVGSAIRALLARLRVARVAGLGVGVAGQVDPDAGVVLYAPNLRWRDVPLRAWLAREWRCPVEVLNDVQAAAYGEWRHGAGRGVDEMVCLFVGTGIGGGVVSGGRLVRGCSGSAGELGHLTVALDGPLCRCGNRGCLEALAGGWAIARTAREAVARDPRAGRALAARAGGDPERITARVVSAAADAGDPLAQAIVGAAASALAAGAASVVNAFNPCLLLLGGGVMAGMPGLFEAVRAELAGRALEAPLRHLRVERTALGRHAGVVGAAAWTRDRAAGGDARAGRATAADGPAGTLEDEEGTGPGWRERRRR